ncbi:metal ABC transporter permease [Nitrosophilus alvini]|uniref:metal ABC transporter permease n=1 Tax=Nitrosophilus alvini TaxID=2714855 RepID=UPI00190A85F2|nr:iron chelate uptake ABC transporter family permease subunit [Nitrosophilus alvini]
MLELFENSIYASLLLSVAIGIIGSLMLINRYGFLAASIAHGSYGGVGMAIYFGFSILLGATLFSIALALLLSYITYKNPHRSDTLIGVIWAVGMSIGIIFTNLAPGYNVDLMSFLFGDILMVPETDLYYMAVVDIVLIVSAVIFYNHLLALSYDRDFALLRGVNVKALHTFVLVLIALTVVMSIRSVGLILVIALFSIPPYIAEKFTKNLKEMMVLSASLSAIFCLLGLYVAYVLDIPATASIILTAALFFALVFFKNMNSYKT